MDKERKQVFLLVGLLIVIAGVLGYFNWHRFVPKPGVGVSLPPPLPQLMFDAGERDGLFERVDYKALDEFTNPVDSWNVGKVGNEQPFRTLIVEEGS